MARILVTGATGFIGGRVVESALARGWSVRALARAPERAGALRAVEVFRGDLRDPGSLAGIERGIDVVVHCAALLGKWSTPEREIREVNVGGTQNLLDRFRGASVRRFVHLGAGGTTGPVRARMVDETYPCAPATAYERSKWEAERAVLACAAATGLAAVVLRPTFTYGPGDPHKLPLFRAIRRGRFAFIGDGTSVLHPVFVDDLVEGIFLGIERARPGEVYIVGGEAPATKRELVGTIADALGVRRPWLRIPRPLAWAVACALEPVGRLGGFEPPLTRSRVMMMADNFGYSIDKARRELGYRPATGLREGIERAVAAYRAAGLL